MMKINCITCVYEKLESNKYCYCGYEKAEKVIRHRFSQHECPVHKFKKECKDKKHECDKYTARHVNKHEIEAHKICDVCERWQ